MDTEGLEGMMEDLLTAAATSLTVDRSLDEDVIVGTSDCNMDLESVEPFRLGFPIRDVPASFLSFVKAVLGSVCLSLSVPIFRYF